MNETSFLRGQTLPASLDLGGRPRGRLREVHMHICILNAL